MFNRFESREIFRLMSDKEKLKYLYKIYLPSFYEKEKRLDEIQNKVLPEKNIERALTEKIEDFKNSNKKILLVSVSGFAGVGKTFAVKKLEEIAKNKNLPEKMVGTDTFIGTARNSKERMEMTENRKNFVQNFYTRSVLSSFLDKITKGKAGEKILEEGVYNREDGGKLNGKIEFQVPEGKYLLMVEGFNATQYAKEVEDNNPQLVDHFDLVILDDPAESLARALFRDVSDSNKKVDLKIRTIERLKEYSEMWVDIFKNIGDADHVIFNNNASEAIGRLFEEYLRLTGSSHKQALGILKLAENQFDREKFLVNDNPKFLIKSKITKEYIKTLKERLNIIIREVK